MFNKLNFLLTCCKDESRSPVTPGDQSHLKATLGDPQNTRVHDTLLSTSTFNQEKFKRLIQGKKKKKKVMNCVVAVMPPILILLLMYKGFHINV